jgi:hypothetical protein
MTPGHITLLGDSIFDNGAYTGGAPDVLTHLRSMLPKPWSVSSEAEDGSRMASLAEQVAKISPHTTHLAVAIGGNDALANRDLLTTSVTSTTKAFELFAARIEEFEASYRAAIQAVLRLGRPTILCTIYNGWLDAAEARIARVALMMFNDAILRVAIDHTLSVIDLRVVCSQREDYANAIEPSGIGGRKIASAIAGALGVSEAPALATHVYAGFLRG